MPHQLTHLPSAVVITTPSSSRANPEHPPSPKDVRLPPSPPFDSDDDSDISPPRPVLPKRPDSDSSLPSRAVIHQLIPRRHFSPQPPTTPLTRPHTSTGMPPMQRAHSSPGIDSSGRFITIPVSQRRPSSPLSAGRRRSPLRSAMDESYPVSWSGLNIEPNIPEHAELELSPALHDGEFSPLPSYHSSLPRSRRRPQSPLHPSASAPTLYASARSVSPGTRPGTHSPSARYYVNDPFPGSSFSSVVSSMPSTPSSFRSRSPSISSLETIEDTPDEEEAARRADEEDAKIREDDGDGGRRRSSLEIRGSTLRSNKERKRWSVCGGERRADFSLEPIEE